jgi:hypothetical protein
MLWKKSLSHSPYFKFVAVLEVEEIHQDKQIDGRREFSFKLADGTTETRTFEPKEYQQWWSSFLKEGFVVNP